MSTPMMQSKASQWSFFLVPEGDREASIAIVSEQIEAIAERLVDTEAHTGWSEEDVLRVMKREGHALQVFHQYLKNLLRSDPKQF